MYSTSELLPVFTELLKLSPSNMAVGVGDSKVSYSVEMNVALVMIDSSSAQVPWHSNAEITPPMESRDLFILFSVA